jgi:RHH-type rel operon transcriptional repressor/antitoxin RelB
MLAIRLPEDVEARLDALAKRTGRTKTFYARQAILEHLGDMEDYYLAATAYEEFKTSGEKAITSEEMRRRLGLED